MSARNGQPSALWMPRSRGAVSGLLLVILGVFGALIPFVGPHFNAAYTPDQNWAWSTARGLLEVLPGAVTVLGGLLLILSGNRITAMVGSWLAVLGGIWFVIGRTVAPVVGIGSPGDPIAGTTLKRAALEIAYFSGLGALIVFVGAIAVARLAVRLASDIEALARVEAAREEREARAAVPSLLYREPSYLSGLEEPVHESVEADPESAEGRHLQRPEAAARRGATYFRWPRPERG